MSYEGIMNCFRCEKPIVRADATNADYVIADDAIEVEFRPFPFMQVADIARWQEEYVNRDDTVEMIDKEEVDMDSIVDIKINSPQDIEDVAKDANKQILGYIDKNEPVDVQKTAIVCPECWLPTDQVIWGVHKGVVVEESGEAPVEEPED